MAMKRLPAVGLCLTLMLGAALTWGVNVGAQSTDQVPAPAPTTEPQPVSDPPVTPVTTPTETADEAENATLELIRKGRRRQRTPYPGGAHWDDGCNGHLYHLLAAG